MAGSRGLYILPDGSSNGTTPINARLAQAGLIADDGASALSIRQGVFYDGQGNVVSGNTDTGTMSYSVRACQFVLYLLGVASSGAVTAVNDAVFKATTTAAPGSNSRIDVIWVRQHAVASDGGPDANNILEIGVTQGTPAASPTVPVIPTGAMALAQAIMPAGATSTNALTITQTHGWTTTHGSAIPVRNVTERNALTPFDSMSAYRLDLHTIERYNGTAWITPSAIRYDSTSATVTVTPLNTTIPVTNWLTNTYNVGDIGYAAGVFTAATAGIYRWEATVQWPTLGTTFRVEQFILVNGVANAAGQQSINFPAASGAQYITTGFTLQLAAGDTVQLALQATTSGVSGVQPMAFSLTRVV